MELPFSVMGREPFQFDRDVVFKPEYSAVYCCEYATGIEFHRLEIREW